MQALKTQLISANRFFIHASTIFLAQRRRGAENIFIVCIDWPKPGNCPRRPVTLAGGSWPWGGGRPSKRDLRDIRDLRDSGRFGISRRPADP